MKVVCKHSCRANWWNCTVNQHEKPQSTGNTTRRCSQRPVPNRSPRQLVCCCFCGWTPATWDECGTWIQTRVSPAMKLFWQANFGRHGFSPKHSSFAKACRLHRAFPQNILFKLNVDTWHQQQHSRPPLSGDYVSIQFACFLKKKTFSCRKAIVAIC